MKKNKLAFLSKRKKVIDHYLENVIDKQRELYAHQTQADELFTYLNQFTKAGKTIRGALFLETLSLLGKNENEITNFLPLAAAMEIIHSALLIQDDYMDQDDQRRGAIAFHKKVEKKAKRSNIKKPKLLSISSMICATDICFFMAFSEMAKIETNYQNEIITFLSKEYINVGFAQWKDVELGLGNKKATLNELKSVYLYKTARYTFSMPILVASIICQIDQKVRDHLNTVAESLGMVFQITDDYLNLFGNPKLTGKPIGSDIIQDKQTIYKYYLNKTLKQNSEQSEYFLSLFGKKDLNNDEIKKIQNEIKKRKINIEIDTIITKYEILFETHLKKIDNQKLTLILKELFFFIKNRKK